jgi:hypothetical protein
MTADGWRVVQRVDLNGPGQLGYGVLDTLYQNPTTGMVAIEWDRTPGKISVANPGLTWNAVEAVDLTGDGKAEIIFQQPGGAIGYWRIDGTSTIHENGVIGSSPGPNWHLIGATARNGAPDGDQLLFNDPLTKQYGVWQLGGPNGTTFESSKLIGTAEQVYAAVGNGVQPVPSDGGFTVAFGIVAGVAAYAGQPEAAAVLGIAAAISSGFDDGTFSMGTPSYAGTTGIEAPFGINASAFGANAGANNGNGSAGP